MVILFFVFLCPCLSIKEIIPIFASMKRLGLIEGMMVLLLAACTVATRQGTSPTSASSPELAAIDSLMWRQPDSALMRLMPYFNDTCRDVSRNVSENKNDDSFGDVSRNVSETTNDDSSGDVSGNVSTTYNRHYANLLLAELLYKNDYAQTNRRDLQRAVYYFDSLCCRDATQRVSTTDPTIAFLDARAHYINGVGYYGNDSVLEACKEYLKTLDVMEGRFEEKNLVGKKAKFMAYTYNRLGDMFSEQFMQESAIKCYENALVYCKIEPTSPIGVSNIYYRIGKQYDKTGEKRKANEYYTQALNNMPSNNNLVFRDLVSTKALCDYQLGYGYEQSINTIKQILIQADNENEYLYRFLIIGGILFEESLYDSAMYYLEPVFENHEDIGLQTQAANYLYVIYDRLGDKEKADICIRFLADYKKLDWEDKSLVSQLEELFENHMQQKQIKKTDEEKHRERIQAIKKTIAILIPISLFFVALLVLWTRAKHKKSITAKEEHHQKEMEHERQTHRMQQSALSGRLKQKNKELHELKEQIRRQEDLNETPNQAESFTDEPICRLIMERVKEGQFKSQMDCSVYRNYALSKDQLITLQDAANRHFNRFTERLAQAYPDITKSDLDYCCLYLLGLTDADVSALMQRAYNTVNERNSKLKKILGCNKSVSAVLFAIANNQTLD